MTDRRCNDCGTFLRDGEGWIVPLDYPSMDPLLATLDRIPICDRCSRVAGVAPPNPPRPTTRERPALARRQRAGCDRDKCSHARSFEDFRRTRTLLPSGCELVSHHNLRGRAGPGHGIRRAQPPIYRLSSAAFAAYVEPRNVCSTGTWE